VLTYDWLKLSLASSNTIIYQTWSKLSFACLEVKRGLRLFLSLWFCGLRKVLSSAFIHSGAKWSAVNVVSIIPSVLWVAEKEQKGHRSLTLSPWRPWGGWWNALWKQWRQSSSRDQKWNSTDCESETYITRDARQTSTWNSYLIGLKDLKASTPQIDILCWIYNVSHKFGNTLRQNIPKVFIEQCFLYYASHLLPVKNTCKIFNFKMN
jgi:hypothetical protein